MEFCVLGPFEVVEWDRRVVLPRGRARALLALLAMRAGEVVSTDRLIDRLWGDSPPPTALTALQGHVSALRKRLGPGRGDGAPASLLETRPPGYVLAIERTRVDAHRFKALLDKAVGAPAAERAAMLRAALALWRGPALADFEYEPFAQTDIALLEGLRLAATEELLDSHLALGRHAEVIGQLTDLVTDQPLRERPRAQLMLALYRSGRQAEALAVYRATRRLLTEELGIEPGPALRALEHSILRQDPALELPAGHAPAAESREGEGGGPPVAAGPWLPPGRKLVTVAFLDLSPGGGAVADGAADPEAVRRIVGRHVDTAASVIARHGGSVEQIAGDTVVAVFGIPTAHEDDALRAVRAMVELREELGAVKDGLERTGEIRVAGRAGVDTGEVVVGDPTARQPLASGEAVNAAARLVQAARAGEVLVGDATQRLVRDGAVLEPVGPPVAGGNGQPSTVWRLIDVLPAGRRAASGFDVPMVGRAAELARLLAAFEETVETRRPHLVGVVGEPGIGKSRLARELAASLSADALVLVGRCPAYGGGMTFWPLREMVLQVADTGREGIVELLGGEADADAVAVQVASAIGLTEQSGRPDALFPAFRRLFEALARRRPVAVVVEDVQWAQPTLLDLMRYLAMWAEGPVFLICLARPELLEERGSWLDDQNGVATLVLAPLGRDDTES